MIEKPNENKHHFISMLKIKNGRRFYMKKSTIGNGSSHRLRPQKIRKSSGTVQQNECAMVS